MKLTIIDLKNIFKMIIQERKSFEEASIWASEMMRKDDHGQLEIPRSDVSKIFSGLTFLSGLDLEVSRGAYLHSTEDVFDKYYELFCEYEHSRDVHETNTERLHFM